MSSSPPKGGRRARTSTKRRGAETPPQDAEPQRHLPAPDAPARPVSERRARQQEIQRSGRRRANPPAEQPDSTGFSGPNTSALDLDARLSGPNTSALDLDARLIGPNTGALDLDARLSGPRTGAIDLAAHLAGPSTGALETTGFFDLDTGALDLDTSSLDLGMHSAPPNRGSNGRGRRSAGPRTTSLGLSTHESGPDTSSIGLNTTELAIVRGRRKAPPRTARRRAEVALGRAVSPRRVWGATLIAVLALIVPSASMLPKSVTINDGGFSGGALDAPPDSDLTQPDPSQTSTDPNRAQAMAKAAASAASAAAEKAAAEAAAKGKKTSNKPSTPSTGNTGRLTHKLSGLPWVSGVYAAGEGVAGVTDFGNWRGSTVDVVIDWPARASWDDIVNPDWLYNTWKNTPYTKVFGVAPIPEGDDSATMAGCAAGSYNDKWREFAQNIKNAGLDDETVIRLGWEFNGDWYKWQATNPAQFAECWRQIVSTSESVAPALLWDWTVNRGKGASVVDARQAYPGDAYVDIVGVDSYDMWPGATNEATWAEQYSGTYGLKFWSDFASDHGKKLSVPEWGVYPGNAASNGGDNAFYIAKMQAFFKSEGSHLAYESYFNEQQAYIAASLFGPDQNPVAAAKYKSLFGS